MKIKKITLFFGGIILLLIILDKCTSVNITSASIFKKKEYKSYPFLKDGVNSENYEIKHIVNSNYGLEIVYDTMNNYFIVDTEYLSTQKINYKGEITVYRGYHPKQSHYVIGENNVIYNLSKKENQKEFVSKTINIDHIKTFIDWFGFYTSYYEKADVVIYKEDINNKTNPLFIYLNINNKWFLIPILEELEDELSNYKNDFPAKGQKLIYLKDYNNKLYSKDNPSRTSLPWKNSKVKTNKENLKMKFFTKEFVYDRYYLIYFSLNPIRFKGVAFYNLENNGEVLKFKNTLHKSIFVKDRPVLYHFTLPQQFRNKTQISFICYDPYIGNRVDGEGLYIVKRRNEN